MQISEWDRSLATRAGHEDTGVQGSERDAHVGRVGRDAMLARPENGVGTVHAVDGRAARAGNSLVAGSGPVVEIHAPGTLEKIGPDGRHGPELRGPARAGGLRQGGEEAL